MVDNGAAEATKVIVHPDGSQTTEANTEHTSLDFEEIVYWATWIGADEIILPDKKLSAEETLARCADSKIITSIPPVKRAIVPQGKDVNEWKWCYKHLDMGLRGNYATVCITKDYELFPGGREALATWLRSLPVPYRHIHYLGIKDNPRDEIQRAIYSGGVRSLDSGIAMAYAQHDKLLSEWLGHESMLWNAPYDERLLDRNMSLLDDWSNPDAH